MYSYDEENNYVKSNYSQYGYMLSYGSEYDYMKSYFSLYDYDKSYNSLCDNRESYNGRDLYVSVEQRAESVDLESGERR